MLRFAIYARYSSENQNEKSIDDQVRECITRVKQMGGFVSDDNVYTDYAISGSHLHTRPSIGVMMAKAKEGHFDAVIAEDLSRLSRDQEDIAGLYKRLNFAGVKLYTLSEGEVNELHIGFKGTQNAMYLKDLAQKTLRGQKGIVEQGKIPGGNSYGYNIVKEFDSRGEPIKGKRSINADEAEIVVRIFKEYVSGKGTRAIAKGLNDDGILAPRDGQWAANTIIGNSKRGNGIINNELYLGKIVFNRQSFVKNPDTGKRQSRPNPRSQWVIHDVPELRIIPDDLWQEAHLRKNAVAKRTGANRKRPPRPLSGLLKCGCCGGSFVIVGGQTTKNGKKSGQYRYGCSTRREKGTCNNIRTIGVDDIENKIFTALGQYLTHPDGLAVYVKDFHKNLHEMKAEERREFAHAKRKLAQTQRNIDSIIKAITDGLYSPSMKEKMQELEAEKLALKDEIKCFENESNVIEFLPNVGEMYERRINALREALNESAIDRHEAVEVLRSMITRIRLTPNENDKTLSIEIDGELGAILNFCNGNKDIVKQYLTRSMSALVAGVRNRHKHRTVVIPVC